MYRIIYWLSGYLCISLKGDGALKAVNALHGEGLSPGKLTPTEEGYSFTCTVFNADTVLKRLEELGIEHNIVKKCGAPFLLRSYLQRTGLWVGLVLALFIMYGSTRLVWDVRVECADPIDEAAALDALSDLGVYSGARINDIDVYKAELSFLMNNSQYSKAVINMQGSVACVQLKLRDKAQHREENTLPCNIVATEPGLIYSMVATKGKPTVQKGDTVAKGDILIAGNVTGVHGEEYLYSAAGSVKAMVYREYTVIIPLKTTEKYYTGKKETKTTYTVLGECIPLFKDEKTSFKYATATAQKNKTRIFGLRLPVVKETVTYEEYLPTSVTITETAAKEKALSAFDKYLEREAHGEVIEKETDIKYSEELEAVILTGTASVITEIGEINPISNAVKKDDND